MSDPARTPVALRLATAEEYDEVGRLSEAGYRADGFLDGIETDYDRVLRDARARAEAAELVVAIDDGRLVGTVTWCPGGSSLREVAIDDTEGEFRILAVDPRARRRGVGSALVQWCVARARADGLSQIVMCSMDRMIAAHAMYERLGFDRLPERDWSPVAGVDLLGFRLRLRGRDLER